MHPHQQIRYATMYGATFKELTTVTDVEVLQDKSIMFTLSHLFNGYELCSVTGYIESSVKLVSVERNNTTTLKNRLMWILKCHALRMKQQPLLIAQKMYCLLKICHSA